jgi:predicted metal-binding membrane protein
MTSMSMEALVQRDRRVILFGVVSITVIAWLYLVFMTMNMDVKPSMVDAMARPRASSWSPIDFALMFVMWAVMMVGMMLPTASPMILMFARVNRDRPKGNGSLVPTWVFIAGYVVIWSVFSLAATIVQWALLNTGWLSPMMTSTNVIFGGFLLISAGIYQWTPIKQACLRYCQTPLGFLMTRWRDGADGAFRMGLSHGAYCVGCCWVLMALLFVGGVMNLVWMAALTILVLLEKIAPLGPWPPRIIGLALFAWGGWVLATAHWEPI